MDATRRSLQPTTPSCSLDLLLVVLLGTNDITFKYFLLASLDLFPQFPSWSSKTPIPMVGITSKPPNYDNYVASSCVCCNQLQDIKAKNALEHKTETQESINCQLAESSGINHFKLSIASPKQTCANITHTKQCSKSRDTKIHQIVLRIT